MRRIRESNQMKVILARICFWGAILSCSASAASIRPIVDLGWLRVTKDDSGWQVVRVFDDPISHEPLQLHDLVVGVDGKRIVGMNALAAGRILAEIGHGAGTVSVVREGKDKLLHRFPPKTPLLKEGWPLMQREGDFLEEKNSSAPSISLPDLTGSMHTVHFGSKWVLVHIWSTRCSPCWADMDAVNEFANPAPESLIVVAVSVDDTSESLERFTKEHAVRVLNLIAGGWDGKFPNDFNVVSLPADVLIDPEGNVVFVGVGAASFRSVLELLKAYSLL